MIRYLEDGTEVEVMFGDETNGYVVKSYYLYPENPECSSAPFFAARVFDIPPIARKAQEVSELEVEEQNAQKRLGELQFEIEKLEDKRVALLKRRKDGGVIEELADFLDGKITHFVLVSSYRVELLECSDCRRAVSLKADRYTGNFYWRIDSVDVTGLVYPARSEDEARKIIRETLSEILNQEGPDVSTCLLAQKWGVEIPPEILEQINRKKNEEKAKRIAELQAEIEKAREL